MAVFKLQYNGYIVGSFKTGDKLTNAINKILKKNQAQSDAYGLGLNGINTLNYKIARIAKTKSQVYGIIFPSKREIRNVRQLLRRDGRGSVPRVT